MSGDRKRKRQRSVSTGRSSPEPPSDSEAISYLERAAAADQDTIRRRAKQFPGRYHLISQLEPKIIETLLKYAKGECDECGRPYCVAPIDLSAALKELTGCSTCRAVGAIESKIRRDNAKETPMVHNRVKVRLIPICYLSITYVAHREAARPPVLPRRMNTSPPTKQFPYVQLFTARVCLLIATRPSKQAPDLKAPDAHQVKM